MTSLEFTEKKMCSEGARFGRVGGWKRSQSQYVLLSDWVNEWMKLVDEKD